MAQITRKNEREREENIKRKLYIMADVLSNLEHEELEFLFNSNKETRASRSVSTYTAREITHICTDIIAAYLSFAC